MDVLYEESAVNAKAVKDAKKYKVVNVISWISLFIGLLFALILVPNLIASFSKAQPTEDITAEQIQEAIMAARSLALFSGMQVVFFGLLWFFLFSLKKRINVSYDYTFVSGELRIAKVFNINKRKFLYKIQSGEILQLGDVENDSYDRLTNDPATKRILLTPNGEPAEGKFFMYILTGESSGKKLYILECREELLVNMLRFVKRGTLESDYVSQEKKKAQGK